MNNKYGAVIAAIAIALTLGLAGCSPSNQTESGASDADPAITDEKFEAHELRDAGDLEGFFGKAMEKAVIAKGEASIPDSHDSTSSGDDGEKAAENESDTSSSSNGSGSSSSASSSSASSIPEIDGNKDVASAFAKANDLYRNGDYAGAKSAYNEVLGSYPAHFGANVNLTLAELQLQENEDALVQALTCIALFPDDQGCLLNAQAAGVACGFGTGDLEDIITRIEDDKGTSRAIEIVKADAGDYSDSYRYNNLWSNIDQGLYLVNKGDMGYDEGLADLIAELDEFEERTNDPQAAQLHAYLDAVMRQLGMA